VPNAELKTESYHASAGTTWYDQLTGVMTMLVDVWEVYKKDSQECCMFLTEELAKNQNVFDKVDLISKSVVDLCEGDIAALNKGLPVIPA
jgi:hypothetical protein